MMAKPSLHVVAVFAVLATLLGAGASQALAADPGQESRRNTERMAPGVAPDNRNAAGNRQNQLPQYSEAQENARRQANRMSPEDRRNLRRQINEAGQEMYPPRR